MAISTKLRWKKYIEELRFTHEELKFVHEISKAASREFQAHYEDYCEKNQMDIGQLNKQHAERLQKLYNKKAGNPNEQKPQLDSGVDGSLVVHTGPDGYVNSTSSEEYPAQLGDYQMTKDEQEIHESFHKIFRKLAMLLHPDKLAPDMSPHERKEKLKMFKEAKAAFEERRYFVLLDLAQQFNVVVPRNYRQQIRWMKKELKHLNATLIKEKDTYNYLFSECDTAEQKDKLVIRFMSQIFGAQIFQINA